MDTKDFISKFPELSAGLTETHYDKETFTIRLKPKTAGKEFMTLQQENYIKTGARLINRAIKIHLL